MQTAEMLVKSNFYPATVNRAYYSCLQFILHIIHEKLNHPPEHLQTMPRNGTHSKAQYLLELTLSQKNRRDYIWFQEKFPAFKEDRVRADYHGDPMSSGDGYEAIATANSIINLLKTHYK